MTTQDRTIAHVAMMRENKVMLGALTKADLLAAVNAIDDWVVANASAFNTAVPLPARTALTTAQKAQLLAIIVRQRYAVGA